MASRAQNIDRFAQNERFKCRIPNNFVLPFCSAAVAKRGYKKKKNKLPAILPRDTISTLIFVRLQIALTDIVNTCKYTSFNEQQKIILNPRTIIGVELQRVFHRAISRWRLWARKSINYLHYTGIRNYFDPHVGQNRSCQTKSNTVTENFAPKKFRRYAFRARAGVRHFPAFSANKVIIFDWSTRLEMGKIRVFRHKNGYTITTVYVIYTVIGCTCRMPENCPFFFPRSYSRIFIRFMYE